MDDNVCTRRRDFTGLLIRELQVNETRGLAPRAFLTREGKR